MDATDDPMKTRIGMPMAEEFDPMKTMLASPSPLDLPPPSPFDTPAAPSGFQEQAQPQFQPPPNNFGDAPRTPSFQEPDAQFNNDPFAAQQNQPFGQSPTEWSPPPAPNAEWSNQGVGANTPFVPPGMQGQNQTFAIVSLITGILSLCCYVGWLLGPTALIFGYLQNKKIAADPAQFGGKGLALAGMICGGIGLALSLLLVIYYVLIIGLVFGGAALSR